MCETKNKFNALLKEALFTGEMLCSGYCQIRNANYSTKGVYFQAFTSLSTGFERIGKLCYLLIYAIENNGQFPTSEYMKKSISHDIIKLYREILKFKNTHNIQYDYLQDLDEHIYTNILEILSRFGKGDRYANIDLLLNDVSCEDPISFWYKEIDLYIFEKKVSKKRKEKMREKSNMIQQLFSGLAMVMYTGEDEKEINNIFDGSFRAELNSVVAPYRQLFVFHVIRFFVESLHELEKIVRNKNLFDIPYFMEIFGVFYNDDSYMKRRKTIHLRK